MIILVVVTFSLAVVGLLVGVVFAVDALRQWHERQCIAYNMAQYHQRQRQDALHTGAFRDKDNKYSVQALVSRYTSQF